MIDGIGDVQCLARVYVSHNVEGRRGTQSLGRALRLIDEVARSEERGLRLTDLVARVAVDSSTAHRILSTLVAENVLVKGADRRYALGRRVYELGLVASRLHDEHAVAEHTLRRLAERLDVTVFLSAGSAGDTVCVARLNPAHPAEDLRTTVGTRRPLGIGAGGMAMLAAMPEQEAAAVVRANEARYRAFGRHTSALLRRRLADARVDGFARTDSYFRSGITGLGLMVPTAASGPPLALSVVAETRRLPPRANDLLAEMRSAAAEAGRRITSSRTGQ